MTELSYKLIRYRFENNLSIKELAKEIIDDYSCIQSAEVGKENFQKRVRTTITEFIYQRVDKV